MVEQLSNKLHVIVDNQVFHAKNMYNELVNFLYEVLCSRLKSIRDVLASHGFTHDV